MNRFFYSIELSNVNEMELVQWHYEKNACSVGLKKNLFKCYWSHFMIEAFRGCNRFNKQVDFSLTFFKRITAF